MSSEGRSLDPQSNHHLNEIYQLSEDITESQAQIAVITYNEQKSGLTVEKMRSRRIESLRRHIDRLTFIRNNKIMIYYSNIRLPMPTSVARPLPTPLPIPLPSPSLPPSPSASPSPPPSPSPQPVIQSRTSTPISSKPITCSSSEDDGEAEEESKWSTDLIPPEEKAYYEKCKQYCYITQMPLVSISDDIFDDKIELISASLVCVINQHAEEFDEKRFLSKISNTLNISDITIRKIQKGCIKVIFEIYKKVASTVKKIEIRALYKFVTDKVLEELGKLKILFMFMGDINALDDMQKFRNQITLDPQWNLIYDTNHTYWSGTTPDTLDRGDQPYYCPVGWKRYSLYVNDHFYEKFKGWCICYHGTKFSYGLSILLSGLAPAKKREHGYGVYATPSIIYASHPRYTEVKQIESTHEKTFFKKGKYVQFVLQCRVHPDNILKFECETLKADSTIIDSKINNNAIEWVVNTKGQPIMDFNDPNSTIVCTGLMVRVTDSHPGLLPESQWWFNSHLCNDKKCCCSGIDLNDLKKQKDNEDACNIIYE